MATLSPSRRTLLQLAAVGASAAPAAALAFPAASAPTPPAPSPGTGTPGRRTPEEMLAALSDGVYLNLNESPHGPGAAALSVLARTPALSGRYGMPFASELAALFAEQNGLRPECVVAHPGSFVPLRNAALAFTSTSRPLVYGAPTFDVAFFDADGSASMPQTPVPLTDHRLDVRRLLAAAPTAGAIHVCNPNNPTGLATSQEDIDWLIANKPKDSVVIIDEAYIHFGDAPPSLWRVAAGQDVVVLRTFSKIYGLAGLRCGLACARPDLLRRMSYLGVDVMPMPSVLAALASLQSPGLVAERRAYNARVKAALFAGLAARGRRYLPSEACFAMIRTNRPARGVLDALAARRIHIAPVASAQDWVRVSFGTLEQTQILLSGLDEVLA